LLPREKKQTTGFHSGRPCNDVVQVSMWVRRGMGERGTVKRSYQPANQRGDRKRGGVGVVRRTRKSREKGRFKNGKVPHKEERGDTSWQYSFPCIRGGDGGTNDVGGRKEGVGGEEREHRATERTQGQGRKGSLRVKIRWRRKDEKKDGTGGGRHTGNWTLERLESQVPDCGQFAPPAGDLYE